MFFKCCAVLYFWPLKDPPPAAQADTRMCVNRVVSAYQGLVKLFTTQTITACLKTDEYGYENPGCKTLESTMKQA